MPIKLVIFDVEGVLIPKWRFLLFGASKDHGPATFIKFSAIGLLYTVRLLTLERSLRTIFKSLKGINQEKLSSIFNEIPLTPGSVELFNTLNILGLKTALISSGLPDFCVNDLAKRLGADYFAGIKLYTKNGFLTGEIGGDVIKDGKISAMNQILAAEGISAVHSAIIADDFNNQKLFNICGLGIGFNPDYQIARKADYVINEDLSDISNILTNGAAITNRISKSNLIRELIHTSGLLVPFICIYLLNNMIVATLLLVVAIIYSTSEFLRLNGVNVPIISTITLWAADRSELQEYNTSPIFHALGIALTLLIFPPPICYATIAVLTLGDSFASIFGKKFGRTKVSFNTGKSVEGSIAGLMVAFLGALLFVDPLTAMIGAASGILIEMLPLPIDDNMTMPFASGLAMLIFNILH